MLLFPHQRTVGYWFAFLVLPLWCLVVGSAALTEVTRLFLPPAEWMLAGILLSCLIALLPCCRLLIRLASISTPSQVLEQDASNHETMEVQPHSDEAEKASQTPSSVPWLLDVSWCVEIALLLAMALIWRVPLPFSTAQFTPIPLALMGLLFCLRGWLLHLALLRVLGVLTLGVTLFTFFLLPPPLWQGGMLTSCTLMLWGAFLHGIWLHWGLLWWLCWEYRPQHHQHLFRDRAFTHRNGTTIEEDTTLPQSAVSLPSLHPKGDHE